MHLPLISYKRMNTLMASTVKHETMAKRAFIWGVLFSISCIYFFSIMVKCIWHANLISVFSNAIYVFISFAKSIDKADSGFGIMLSHYSCSMV